MVLAPAHRRGLQCDIGSNINVTPDRSILCNYVTLSEPFDLHGADASVRSMLCIGHGDFHLAFLDDTHTSIRMYHCPQLSETLLSPQAICDDNSHLFRGFTIHCSNLDNAYVRFHRNCPGDQYSDAPLARSNNLYYFAQLLPALNGQRFLPTSNRLSAVLSTELWHQRLGHPGMHQLRHLQQCTTGLPHGLHRSIHPLHACPTCEHARSRRPPLGPTSRATDLIPGSRFHLDFGFMRASSNTFLKTKTGTRVVQSRDGFTSYLIIADAVTRYTWVFLTASKDPPLALVSRFLQEHGLKTGYRAIRVDQGGELCTSDAIRRVFFDAGYSLEPTGNDSANQNGKVERINGTLATMVRSLLYSAGLHPNFWSYALLHAVHLKNRLWHSAINQTPFQAWTGTRPDLSHLRTFGSLVSPRRNGPRPAKLDNHTYEGVFLGYTSSCANINYIDVQSGRVKVCQAPTHFDESHFTQTSRPPGPKFLFDLGLHSMLPTSVPTRATPTTVATLHLYAWYPIWPSSTLCLHTNSLAALIPLPLGELLDMSSLPHFSPSAHALTASDVMSIEFSNDPFGPSFIEPIPLTGTHETAGIETRFDASRQRLQITHLLAGNPVSRLPRWRSRLKHAYILSLDNLDIPDHETFVRLIASLRDTHGSQHTYPLVSLKLTFDDAINTLSSTGLPLLYFDQLKHIRGHNTTLRASQTLPLCTPVSHRLTRRGLQTQPGWPEWLRSEAEQLDSYATQGMFGTPCTPPPQAAIFHWVWIYKIKTEDNNRKKARAVCDGSTRGGQAMIAGHTYAPTPDMTDLRLFFALAALENKLVFGADVSNAFAEANAPAQEYFMRIDTQFHDWWLAKGNPAIPPGHVIPILKNLQGHPEAPRQWSKHIDAILRQHGFRPTIHAPCLYRATIGNEDVLFLRQVDDFAIATNQESLYTNICNQLDSHLLVPMKRQGLLTHYNGIDIIQTRDYITLHVGSYVRRIVASHGWTDMHPVTLPMSADNEHIRLLDTATPPADEAACKALESKFRYRCGIGELIWAMITCRPEISFPVTKLSQFAAHPAALHYDAVKRVFRYINATPEHGLTYWRTAPHAYLPAHLPPSRLTATVDQALSHDISDAVEKYSPTALHGYVDSDWAADIRHRRSISGIVFKMAGAVIAWKCRVQPTVSLSSTEAEFLAASDAGKMALYLRSILDELHIPQHYATVLYEDNRGALLMANAAQPTKQSRHIDIRNYALLDWVERDLVSLEDVASGLNSSDILTKQTGPLLFARHVDNISGRLPPPYVNIHTPTVCRVYTDPFFTDFSSTFSSHSPLQPFSSLSGVSSEGGGVRFLSVWLRRLSLHPSRTSVRRLVLV